MQLGAVVSTEKCSDLKSLCSVVYKTVQWYVHFCAVVFTLQYHIGYSKKTVKCKASYSRVQWCLMYNTLVCKVQCSDICSTVRLCVVYSTVQWCLHYSAVVCTVQWSFVYCPVQFVYRTVQLWVRYSVVVWTVYLGDVYSTVKYSMIYGTDQEVMQQHYRHGNSHKRYKWHTQGWRDKVCLQSGIILWAHLQFSTQKSRIRETKHLSTDVDSCKNTIDLMIND